MLNNISVIEDSIRGHMGEPTSESPVRDQSNKQIPPGHVEKDLGGLACPRTKSPPTCGPALRTEEPGSSISQKCTRLNGDGTERRNQMSINYPTMEIPQSSRFSSEGPPYNQRQSPSYFDKRNMERAPQLASGQPSHGPMSQAGPAPSHKGPYGDLWQQGQHASALGKTQPHPPEAHSASSVSPNLHYRFDGAPYPPPPVSHSVGRASLQDPRDTVQNPLPPRKRMTPPQHSLHPTQGHIPQLPLKKQALEASGIHLDSYGRAAMGELMTQY